MSRPFSLRRNRAALRGLLRRLRRERRGIAAIEFGIIAPVMLMIYFGLVEVTQGVMIHRKVSQLTRTLADLGAQSTSLTDANVSNIFDSARSIMMPFTATDPGMSIASVVIDSAGVAKVCWSDQRNSTQLTVGSTVSLPTALKVPNTSLILAKASYDFTPQLGFPLTGHIPIGGNTIYMRPRVGQAGGSAGIEQVGRTQSSGTTKTC